MVKTFKLEPSFAQHFTHEGVEFEIRVTDEGDKLEIWEVEYLNNKCIGFEDIVAEFNLEVSALDRIKNIIKQVADKFTDTFNEEIKERLEDEGLEATEEEVEAVLNEIVRIYK